jgi:putative ATP-binding cassette transporter
MDPKPSTKEKDARAKKAETAKAGDEKPAQEKHSLREKLELLKPYWTSEHKKSAWRRVGGILGLTLLEAGLMAAGGYGAAHLAVAHGLLSDAGWAVGTATTMFAGVGAASKRALVTSRLGQDWRSWMTQKFVNAWVGSRKRLSPEGAGANPDQRIAENVWRATDQTLFLGFGAVRAAVGLAVFGVVLWHLAPMMLAAAALIGITTTVATRHFSKNYEDTIGSWWKREGNFRKSVGRVRDYGKEIKLAGLEDVERECLQEDAKELDASRKKLFNEQFKMDLARNTGANISGLGPAAVTGASAPQIDASAVGGYEAGRQNYGQFSGSLGWITQNYDQIKGWSATIDQLIDFKRSLEENKGDILTPVAERPAIRVDYSPENRNLRFENLVLNLPDGTPLVDFGTVTLRPGDRMMVSGPEGSGKSSALCAIREAWAPGGTGRIEAPDAIRFVPQTDYMPDLTLRGMICAPDKTSKYTDAQVKDAMRDAGLEEFIPKMDDTDKKAEYWTKLLSGGQKKKVAFAGAFLHAPETKLLILDEITSALRASTEAELYPKLLDRMKHGIVVSVVHRPAIAGLHNVFAEVEDGKVSYSATPPELEGPAAKTVCGENFQRNAPRLPLVPAPSVAAYFLLSKTQARPQPQDPSG